MSCGNQLQFSLSARARLDHLSKSCDVSAVATAHLGYSVLCCSLGLLGVESRLRRILLIAGTAGMTLILFFFVLSVFGWGVYSLPLFFASRDFNSKSQILRNSLILTLQMLTFMCTLGKKAREKENWQSHRPTMLSYIGSEPKE